MFGGKKEKTRELEDKLRQAEIVKIEYEQLKNIIKGTKNTSDEVFMVLEAGDAQLDKDFKQLAEAFQNGEKDGQKIANAAATSGMGLGKLAELIQRSRQEEQTVGLEIPAEYLEAAGKAAEINMQLGSDCRAGADCLENSQNIGQQLREMAGGMQQSAKSMGVLALSAAIEAGRLGEVGREFVQAAEDVRKLSEIYDSTAAEMIEKMQELEDAQKQQKELIVQMEKRLEENERTIGVLQSEIKIPEKKEQNNDQEMKLTEGLREQEAAVKEISSRLEEHIKLYGHSFQQIEAIGESCMESRKAKGELEDGLARLYDKVKK